MWMTGKFGFDLENSGRMLTAIRFNFFGINGEVDMSHIYQQGP
jgi:hypothetical protein